MPGDTFKKIESLGDIPSKDPYYQNREDLRQQLIDTLNSPVHIASLVGPTGIGKTALINAYVYEQIENPLERIYDLIIWIDCKNFSAECQKIENSIKKNKREANKDFYTYLGEHTGKWLLVLENATQNNLKNLPHTGNGNIIITSREFFWPNIINMPYFKTEESQELIFRLLNVNFFSASFETSKNVLRLATALDHYPLAIRNAAESIVKGNNTLEIYYKDFIAQSGAFEPSIEIESEFYKKIAAIISNKPREEKIELKLIRLLANMGSVYIPRDIINNLARKIDSNISNSTISQHLQSLMRNGILEKMSHNQELYLINAPLVEAIRHYFKDKIKKEIFIVAEELKFQLEKFGEKKLDDEPQRYYRHTKTVIERIIGLEEVDRKKQNKIKYINYVDRISPRRIINEYCAMFKKNIIDNPAKENSIEYKKNQIIILELIIEFTKTLRSIDELDAAYFYILIVEKILKEHFSDFLTFNDCKNKYKLDHEAEEAWTKNNSYKKNILNLFRRTLWLKGALLLRKNVDWDGKKAKKAFNLIDSSILVHMSIIEKFTPENNEKEFDKLKRSFIYIKYLNFYAKIKSCSYEESHDNLLDLIEKFKESLQIDEEKMEASYKGAEAGELLPDIKFDLKNTSEFIIYYYANLASAEKHREKHSQYPIIRILKLKKLYNKDKLMKLLIKDIFDRNQTAYELKQIGKLLYNCREPYQPFLSENSLDKEKAQEEFDKFLGKFIEKSAQINEDKIYTTDRPALEKELEGFIDNLMRLFPNNVEDDVILLENKAESGVVYLPYGGAIHRLEYGIEIFRKATDYKSDGFYITLCKRRIAKYYLRSYEYLKLCTSTDSTFLHDILRKSWKYYNEALKFYKKNHALEKSHLETFITLLGILDLAACFKDENIEIPENEWNNNIQYDYFISCRFILSQLFKESFHHANILFHVWQRLEPKHARIDQFNRDIFDIKVEPSNDYYQRKLVEYEHTFKDYPDDIDAFYDRACILCNMRMYEQASKMFDQILERCPDSSIVLTQKGLIEYKQTHYLSALVFFEYAQKCHGNPDSLVAGYIAECEKELIVEKLNLGKTYSIESREGIFIVTLKEAFAIELQKMLDKFYGEDKRMDSHEVSCRILKSVGKLVPKSIQIYGQGVELQVAEAIGDLADTFSEKKAREEEYRIKKIKKMTAQQLIPSEIRESPIFHRIALKLVMMFQAYFPHFKSTDAINFAKYISESMIDYLGSDRILPYLTLEMQLIRGATEGIKNSITKIKVTKNAVNLRSSTQALSNTEKLQRFTRAYWWNMKGIVNRSNIKTADDRTFTNPKNKFPYLERAGTAEEALRLGYRAPS